jgi:hypothetical protein
MGVLEIGTKNRNSQPSQQQLVQRKTQATRMQAQEIPLFQVPRWPQKTKEGQGQQAKEDYMPHCKKFHRKKPHQVKPEMCMWNK